MNTSTPTTADDIPAWQAAGYPGPRIVIQPGVYSGAPTFAGTRIPVRMIAAMTATYGAEAIIAMYPDLTAEDVELARWYWRNYRKRVMRRRPREEGE